MRVIIIGGSGFLGGEIIKVFRASGHNCVVLDADYRLGRLSSKEKDVEYIVYNFFGGDSIEPYLENTDVVIHLASSTYPSKSMENILYCAQTNIIASLRLFEALDKRGIKRLIFASSGGTVYGMQERLPINERELALPINAYGVSKLTIESYLSIFKSLSGVSLRIANPYGYAQLFGSPIGLIAHTLLALEAGQKIQIWGDGKIVRDYIAVEDVAKAFLLAADLSITPPGRYNIGSGIGKSINEILDECFTISGRSVSIEYKAQRSFDVPAIILDCSKFTKLTDWTSAIGLQLGITNLWGRLKARKC